MFKSRVKFLWLLACFSVFLLCGTLAFCLETQNFGSNVNIQYIAPKEDIWDNSTKTFNREYLNKLLQKISNDSSSSTTNMATVNSLASARTSAGDMRDFSVGKNSGEDISVFFGDFTWVVTYLSKTKTGDTILTLWLNGSSLSLESTWSSGWSDSVAGTYPSNMYGTSYIRAVTLNNGGLYATSTTTSSTCTKSSSNEFALFTMGKLTDYIVTPRQVKWQENEQYTTNIGASHDFSNENWSQTFSSDKFIENSNYAGKDGNDAWADDYIWLPSASEVSCGEAYGQKPGLWDLQTKQNKFSYNAYLRTCISVSSGWSGIARNAYSINTTGLLSPLNAVNNSLYVLPALHLNLTKAAQAAQ